MRANTLLAAVALMAASDMGPDPVQGDGPELVGDRWGSWKPGHKGRNQNRTGKQAANRLKKRAAHKSRMAQKGKR